MNKDKITTEVSNEETVTQNKEPDYFMDGMEYAYHEAIISLKKYMAMVLRPFKLL